MHLPALSRRLVSCLFFSAPVVALAHPGHDGGHDLTWDFVGEVLHRLGSPYHMAPALLLGAVVVLAWRKTRTKRDRGGQK